MCLTFSQYSTLSFWTRSVFACLLHNVFFLGLVVVFAMHSTSHCYRPKRYIALQNTRSILLTLRRRGLEPLRLIR